MFAEKSSTGHSLDFLEASLGQDPAPVPFGKSMLCARLVLHGDLLCSSRFGPSANSVQLSKRLKCKGKCLDRSKLYKYSESVLIKKM